MNRISNVKILFKFQIKIIIIFIYCIKSFFEKSLLVHLITVIVPNFNKLSKWLGHNDLESDSDDRGQQIVKTGAGQL